MNTYSVDDAHGNKLTTGLQEHNAHRVAQRMADDRGESVYLWEPGAHVAEEIAPKVVPHGGIYEVEVER